MPEMRGKKRKVDAYNEWFDELVENRPEKNEKRSVIYTTDTVVPMKTDEPKEYSTVEHMKEIYDDGTDGHPERIPIGSRPAEPVISSDSGDYSVEAFLSLFPEHKRKIDRAKKKLIIPEEPTKYAN